MSVATTSGIRAKSALETFDVPAWDINVVLSGVTGTAGSASPFPRPSSLFNASNLVLLWNMVWVVRCSIDLHFSVIANRKTTEAAVRERCSLVELKSHEANSVSVVSSLTIERCGSLAGRMM